MRSNLLQKVGPPVKQDPTSDSSVCLLHLTRWDSPPSALSVLYPHPTQT